MTNRIETEALAALVSSSIRFADLAANEHVTDAPDGFLNAYYDAAGLDDWHDIETSAMAAFHRLIVERDEYEMIIDHLGDMVAARDTEIARLRADLEAAKAEEQAWISATGIAVQERDIARAELESAREGRDYGC